MITVVLVLVGIIHVLPLAGVLGAERLEAMYGIAVEDPNLLLLLRHRAVLFGILGVFMIVAGFVEAAQRSALFAGMVSTGMFLMLEAACGDTNAHIARVFWTDVVALVLLIVALVATGHVESMEDEAEGEGEEP